MRTGAEAMKKLLGRLWREEAAQNLSEYGLLLILVALALLAASGLVGTAISYVFKNSSANASAS